MLNVAIKLCLIVSLSCSVGSITHGQLLKTVAMTGQPAPGTSEGVVYSNFMSPVLNSSGETAFVAGLTGAGINTTNDQGIWVEESGSLALAVRAGDHAPGTPTDVSFESFMSPVLNSAGQLAFSARVTGSGVGVANDEGVWSDGSGSLNLVARAGDQAPGAENGTIFLRTRYPYQPLLSSTGQTAFVAELTGANVQTANDFGLWSTSSGSLSLVAREGSPMPGVPNRVYNNFNASFPVINPSGQMAFIAIAISSSGPGYVGIWTENAGELTRVVQTGTEAPGIPTGVTYSGFGNVAINSAGQTAFTGYLKGEGIDRANEEGVWSGGIGSHQLVARSGNPAPGTGLGVNFVIFNRLVMNAVGRVAFLGGLTGGETDRTNDEGIWSDGSGSLVLIAREGDHAAGTSAGVNYNLILGHSLNSKNQIAFIATLAGSGIDSTNDRGIWAQDNKGHLRLIVREGNELEVAPGIVRTIRGLSFFAGSGNEDGKRSGFNDAGQVAFYADFTDNSEGIFVSNLVAVPEPSACNVLILGGIAALLHRHRM